MIDNITILILIFFGFLLARRFIITSMNRTLKRRLFQQEYLAILRSPQFKVKGKYE